MLSVPEKGKKKKVSFQLLRSVIFSPIRLDSFGQSHFTVAENNLKTVEWQSQY